jgi:hypothetical protein
MPNPNPLDPRKFGSDISSHQGIINFDTMFAEAPAKPKVEFGVPRTGISWGYRDKWFVRNWDGLKTRAPRSNYHVQYPLQSIKRQLEENMFPALGNDPGEGPQVWDVELDHGATKAQITAATLEAVNRIEDKYGRKPIIYSRPYWVRDHMLADQDWYKEVIWFMAAYYSSGIEASDSHLVNTMRGAGLAELLPMTLFHQSSEKGNGALYGCQSSSMDFCRFRGTDAQFDELFGLDGTPPPTPGEKSVVSIAYDPVEVELDISEV